MLLIFSFDYISIYDYRTDVSGVFEGITVKQNEVGIFAFLQWSYAVGYAEYFSRSFR